MNLRQLAEETGGVAAVAPTTWTRAFDRIVQENSSYYVLGYFTPRTRSATAKLRKIRSEV